MKEMTLGEGDAVMMETGERTGTCTFHGPRNGSVTSERVHSSGGEGLAHLGR